ncbi:unnamed protein product [Thlaspi arvense]|uniref:Uncharacterized protein n=1 Tax=Thlaspi arvense TaxID=13288 RepID=A0AAU9RSF7_THLAR|nr:unnamed protein product [Thlaspi arvense]
MFGIYEAVLHGDLPDTDSFSKLNPYMFISSSLGPLVLQRRRQSDIICQNHYGQKPSGLFVVDIHSVRQTGTRKIQPKHNRLSFSLLGSAIMSSKLPITTDGSTDSQYSVTVATKSLTDTSYSGLLTPLKFLKYSMISSLLSTKRNSDWAHTQNWNLSLTPISNFLRGNSTSDAVEWPSICIPPSFPQHGTQV